MLTSVAAELRPLDHMLDRRRRRSNPPSRVKDRPQVLICPSSVLYDVCQSSTARPPSAAIPQSLMLVTIGSCKVLVDAPEILQFSTRAGRKRTPIELKWQRSPALRSSCIVTTEELAILRKDDCLFLSSARCLSTNTNMPGEPSAPSNLATGKHITHTFKYIRKSRSANSS